jgi:hypothetical protein
MADEMPRASRSASRVHPGLEVLAAMAGRGVHEAGTGIVGDVVASDQRHVEIVAAAEAAQRVAQTMPSRSLAATSRKRLN